MKDFNDLHQAHGLEVVRMTILESALAPTGSEGTSDTTQASNDSVADQKGKNTTGKTKVNDSLTLVKASQIKARPIDWLWSGYLAKAKFHLLAGMPSTGKTTIALAIAATLSNGGLWPDGTPSVQGNVVIWSGEDGLDDTLVPRLMAHGANLENIYFVDDVVSKGEKRPFDPAIDMPMLSKAVKDIGNVSMILVDPIVSAITGDSHKNAEVRRGLQPLVELGEELNAAILGISHFSKGTKGNDPMERVTGSIAYTALARVVLVTAKKVDANNTVSRVFTRAKSNIGLDGGGFNYEIENAEIPTDTGMAQTTMTVFGNALDGSALHLLSDTDDELEGDTESTDTEKFLLELFQDSQDGVIEKAEVLRIGRANGFSERTIQRARKKLGIDYSSKGFGRQKVSVWRLNKKDISANGHSEFAKNSPSIVPIMPFVPSQTGQRTSGLNGKKSPIAIVPNETNAKTIGMNGANGMNQCIDESDAGEF